MKKTAYTGRCSVAHINSGLSYYINNPGLNLALLRLVLPALLCSCHHVVMEDGPVMMRSMQTLQVNLPVNTLEIFMFETGEMRTLDSYQRFEDNIGWEMQAASRKGIRTAFVLANGQWQKEDWMYVSSYDGLREVKTDLEQESRCYPVMTGEVEVSADGRQTVWVELESLCAEIELRSVSCDFNGKCYEDEGISDMRAYLINVNAECRLMPEDVVMPERIINMGELNLADMEGMKEPELLLRYGGMLKSGDRLELGFQFRCYPNNCPEESPGSPFTRLVIEGKIGGITYYWPVNVARENGGSGIEADIRYVYDITITGKGSGSPDILVSSEVMSSKMKVSEWEEKEEYVICY